MTIARKVYLGGCIGDWKAKLIKAYPEIEFLDPFGFNQTRIAEFVSKDLQLIESADACLFMIEYKVYTGACVEIGYASALNKPIIIVLKLKDRIDPMMLGCSTGVYTDVDAAMEKMKRILR